MIEATYVQNAKSLGLGSISIMPRNTNHPALGSASIKISSH